MRGMGRRQRFSELERGKRAWARLTLNG
ncbi:unnamed protein product [Ectocarpus sp. CCAP 1310/34]|nr:unnamed protein product [Ectocarpus sp. CCAP 1310/34]